jgi:hypothetical protein
MEWTSGFTGLFVSLRNVVFLASVLAGCGGGSSTPEIGSADRVPPPPVQRTDHGRYVGVVEIDGVNYFGDAIFAADGETHIYIGGRYESTGAIQLDSAEGSIDFVSPFGAPSGNPVSGGIIGREGEDCGPSGSPSSRWCGRASSADIIVERAGINADSEIRGHIAADGETWTFEFESWSNYYSQPARLGELAGQYDELVAPFARGGMVLTIDRNGSAFFQAPTYHCTGTGLFVPHGDRDVNVFTVEMTISNCDYPYSQYNGEYRGLATMSPSDYWAYDMNVRIWLASSSPDWSAVTMWGQRIPGN